MRAPGPLLALVFALAVSLGWAPALAQADLNHAGLVVRQGDGRLTYAYVAFPEESISGIELLRRSGIPLVAIPFGGLGEGVCSLAGQGCPAAECRRRVCQGPRPDDPFWQYFRQEAPGEWRWLLLGPSATTVRNGDIDGWSWTGGVPELPAVTIAEVARLAAAGVTAPPPATEPRQDWRTYAGATLLLAAIGGAALYVSRRRRHGQEAAA